MIIMDAPKVAPFCAFCGVTKDKATSFFAADFGDKPSVCGQCVRKIKGAMDKVDADIQTEKL